MAKPVSKEVAEKYIDGYFKKKYPIRESAQPTFWNAVKELVVNINADVSERMGYAEMRHKKYR